MCGIAGIIYRDGTHDIGREMTAMLQSMKHRGPDSTGFALYRPPVNGSYAMRVKLADANTPRDFEFHDRLRRHRSEIERRLVAVGATDAAYEESTEYAFNVTFGFDGDLKTLADRVENVPGAEVLSIGRSLQIVKDLGLGDVLDEVGEQLQVAVVVERDAEGVLRLLLDVVHLRPEPGEPGLDLAPVQAQPLREAEVARRVRVGELVPHHEGAVLRRAVERVPRRVGPAVLHRLQHPRHLGPDRMLPVAIDDPRDPAHYVLRSDRHPPSRRRSRKHIEVLLDVPVRHGRAVALPLVPLVVHEHLVHLVR